MTPSAPRTSLRQLLARWVGGQGNQTEVGRIGAGFYPGKSFIALPARAAHQRRHLLAAVAIMRDEAPYVREWLEFHRLAGVEHVFLYDDGSIDDSREIVGPYVECGYVTLIPWSQFLDGIGRQLLAYAHAICTFGPDWRWMTFIDLDEFLFPIKDDSLGTLLARYEDLPVVVVPWHMFGFDGHEKRPQGLVVENYRNRVPFPPAAAKLMMWKSIIDPSEVAAIQSPHFFMLKDGKVGGYTEDRMWISSQRPEDWQNIRSEQFRLNHYFTKSRQELANKASGRDVSERKSPDLAAKRVRQTAELIEQEGPVPDNLILRYVPELRRVLASSPNSQEGSLMAGKTSGPAAGRSA